MAGFTVPTRSSSAQLPGALAQPERGAEYYGAGIAQGLGQLSQVIAKREHEMQLENDKMFLQEKRFELEEKFRAERITLATVQGADAEGIYGKESNRLETDKGSFLSTIEDPARKSMAGALYDAIGSNYLDKVATHDIAQRKVRKARAEALTIHSATQDNIDVQTLEEIDLTVLDEIEDPIKRQKAKDNIYKEWFAHKSNSDPEYAMQVYKDNTESLELILGEALSDIEDNLIVADRARLAKEEKLENEAKEYKLNAQKERSRDYFLSIGTDKQPTIVQLNNDYRLGHITKKQKDSIIDEINNPVVIRDTELFRNLGTAIIDSPHSGLYDDITTAKNLTTGDKQELFGDLVLNLDKEFNEQFKEGIYRLDAVIKTSGSQSPTRELAEEERYQRARLELKTRLQGEESLNEIVEDMVPRYRSRPLSVSSLPAPRFSPKPQTLQELEAAENDLAARDSFGRVDQKTFDDEAALLDEYRSILSRVE